MKNKIAFKALVGSHNYNLNTFSSDKDYKVFVLPTFDDLYYNQQYSNSMIGSDADYDFHDIRKIVNLFWKSNVNFIEVLFSDEVIIENKYVNKIYDLKDEIVTMNLPYLYKACKGMYFNKIKYLEKGTEGTQHLVDQFGYDTKQGLHAYRILDFIIRFANQEFKDFKAAISYSLDKREQMLNIKNGGLTITEYHNLLDHKLSEFEKYEQVYMDQKPKEDIKEELDCIIYQMIKEEMFKEYIGFDFWGD